MASYDYMIENKNYKEFCPRACGYENCKPNHKFGPSIRNYYLIHYVEKGKGTFKVGEKEYHLKEGDAFLIKPNIVTTYCADEKDPWSYIWLGFSGTLAEEFSKLPDVINPDAGIFKAVKTLPANMIEERIVALLFNLYCNMFEDSASYDYSSQVTSYINSHYMEDIKIEKIAKMLGLDRKYLSRIFKQKTGISMQEFLIQKRLTEAKKLLGHGYNVTEAGILSGYSDTFAFSKAFKAYFGVPPKNFKK